MTIFTEKMLREYIAPLNRLIDLQAEIIKKKELEVIQLAFEVNQLKEQLKLAQDTPDMGQDLKPLATRNESWTLKRQRLEREDRQSPEVVAQRMQLEAHWKRRNEEIKEKENAV